MKLQKRMRENLDRTLALMDQAAQNGSKLICFPEVQFSLFFPQFPKTDVSKLAIPIDHEIVKALQSKCRELELVAVPNFYLLENDKPYDASPVIDSDGKIRGISKMVHVPQFPGFYEQDYYTPSDSGFRVYDTAIGNVGVVICFDRHFPESIRTCALQNAQIVVIPTANIKGEPLETFEWEVRIQAMQNGVYIAMSNRVGVEDNMHFAGESIVVDPNGEVVVKADDADQIVYADIDFSIIEETRKSKPYLKWRRPETYMLG